MKRSLRSWLWREPLDVEVDEEIAFHVEMRTRELVARGIDERAARQEAAARLGDIAYLKRTCMDVGRKRDREMRVTQWLDELRHDTAYALRQLRSAPGFALVAVATLALGIGGNSAIFALVDAVLLRPLPFREANRLVMLWERSDSSPRGLVSPLNFLDWGDRNRSLEQMGGFVPRVGGVVMARPDGTTENVARQWVTAGFFDVLGVRPIAGRTFTPSDDSQRANAVVLSESFWRTRFGGDPSIVGRDLRLDGTAYTVVGVVPRQFQLQGESSVWALMPLARRPEFRTAYFLQIIGRLKPDVTMQGAAADVAAIAQGLAQEFPKTNAGRSVALEPLRDTLIGRDLRVTSMLFLAVVGFVLLICCANVANLLLARATTRTRELAIRSAIGAGRRRIIRQLLTESLVLAAIGGALGAAAGAAILKAAPSIIPEGLLPTAVTLAFDTRVALFSAAAAIAVGVLFGLAPAWQATDMSFAQALASDARTMTGRGGKMRGALVVAEIATAVVLLFGAGLLLRTLVAVEHVDRGYRADRVLTMVVDPLGSQYPTTAALTQFFDSIEHEIRLLPGVGNVAWASALPLGLADARSFFFDVVGDPPLQENDRPTADFQIVSAPYFQTLDLPIVAGRGFSDRDTRQMPPVCIVNEAFVRGYLQGRSPIGVRISLRPASPGPARTMVREIVGVARQVKRRPDEIEDFVQIYVPMTQLIMDDMYVLVRPASGRAEALAPAVRGAIARIDKDQLVSVREVRTLDDVVWEATGRHRFRAVMVVTFAGLALLLAMVGVFGVLAYSVQQRLRDFGVRRALGASTNDVLRLVFGSAARLVGAGVLIGLALSVAIGRLLATMLFGVNALDPLTFASVVIVVAATGFVSIAGPAWRAARIDPAEALRTQ
jgi:putative ABC transport system permease protein